MKRLLIAAAFATLVFSGAANAQGMWTGAYTGLSAGGTFTGSGMSNSATCGIPGANDVYLCNNTDTSPATTLLNALSGSSNATFNGSANIGYLWQKNSIVYGVEADVGYIGIQKKQSGVGTYTSGGGGGAGLAGDTFIATTTASSDFVMTFRGRLGYLLSPSLLAYGTGGLAVGRTTLGIDYQDTHNHGGPLGGNAFARNTELNLGWTLGGGFEYAYAQRWSVRAEYMYIDFGTRSLNTVINNPPHAPEFTPFGTSADLNAHVVRVGLNYRLP